MRHQLLYILLALLPFTACSQSYNDSIAKYRQQYKNDFLTDPHSPLKAEDTSFLRFYPVNEVYSIKAQFTRTPDSKPFTMLTHSGKKKNYCEYGYVTFRLKDTTCILHVYQGTDLIAQDAKYKDYLFIPFTDESNYKETFGGGRYLDLSVKDIHDGTLVVDFNKCYNPYCAFASGYNCPIPPKENDLSIPIEAGEKLFGKPVKE